MTLAEAERAVSAYRYYNYVLDAIKSSKESINEESKVYVGIGRNHLSLYRFTLSDLWIDQDLVDRMLGHALARAKAKIDDISPASP